MSGKSQPPPIPPRLNCTSSENNPGGCSASVSSMTSLPLTPRGHPKTNIYPRLHSQVEADCLQSDKKSQEGPDVAATLYQNVDRDGDPLKEFTAMSNIQTSTCRNEMGSNGNTSSNLFHPFVTTSSEQSNRHSHASEQHQSFQQSTHPMAVHQLPIEVYDNQQANGMSEKIEGHSESQPLSANKTQPMKECPPWHENSSLGPTEIQTTDVPLSKVMSKEPLLDDESEPYTTEESGCLQRTKTVPTAPPNEESHSDQRRKRTEATALPEDSHSVKSKKQAVPSDSPEEGLATENDASAVVEKGDHTISDRKVNIQKNDPNDPSLWETDKVLVEGLNPKITKECLFNFLETRADAVPTDIIHGCNPDRVIVVFEEKPDFKRLSKECPKRPVEGSKIQIQMVEKCNSVLVEGINEETSIDLLEKFFANTHQSGGGVVDDLDFHGDEGYCIISFQNPSDAMNVYEKNKNQTLKVGEHSVRIFLYFPCLGVPKQLLQVLVDLDNLPFIICNEYDPHALNFAKKSKEVRKDIEGKLQKKFAKLEWLKSSSQLDLKIVCTVNKDSSDARKILKTWEKDSRQVMDEFMDNISVEKQSVVAEVWDDMLKELKTLMIADPEKVAVILEKKNHVVVIVGYKGNTDVLTKTVRQIIQKAEKNVKKRITKSAKLTSIQCKFLFNSHFQDRVKKEFPNIEIRIEINEKDATFKGEVNDVDKAMTKMYEFISGMKSKCIDISKTKQKLFSSKTVSDMFIEKTKKSEIQVAWNVNDDKLEMHAQDMSIIDKAFKTFSEFIQEKEIEVKNLMKILTQSEWQNCVKDLSENHKEKLDINSFKTAVVITSTDDIFENVVSKIESVIMECSKKYCTETEYLEVSYGEFSFMKYYCDNEIKKVIEGSEDVQVKKDFKNYRFALIGDPEKMSEVRWKLKRIKEGICKSEHKIKGSSAKRYFSSEKGNDTLLQTGKESSCVIMDKELANQKEKSKWSINRNTYFDHHWNQGRPKNTENRLGSHESERGRREEESGDRHVGRKYRGESEGRRRIKERYPRYDESLEDSTVRIISGDLAEVKADVIVNSAHPSLDLYFGAISRSLLIAGGQQLQDECQIKCPNGLSHGQFVITKGGRLKCSQVYHGILKSWDQGRGDALDTLKEFVYACLNTASNNKLTSIAFPALGTGQLGYPADKAAKVMLECAYNFHRENPFSSLTTINIVIFHEDNSTLQDFKYAESKVEEEGKTKSHDHPERVQRHKHGANKVLYDSDEDDEHTSGHRNPGRHLRQHSKQTDNEEGAVLLIWSKSEENIRKAKKYIDRAFENECTSESISGCSDVVKNLSQKQAADLQRMASNCELAVDIYGGIIKLQGLKTNVLEAKANILEYFHELDSQITRKKEVQALAKYVQWQYEESRDKWRKFPEDVSYQIEKAWEKKEKTCLVKDRSGGHYVIDLIKMEEYEKGDKSKVYKIHRMEKGRRGSNAVGTPERWIPCQNTIEVVLKAGDTEYEKVMLEFMKSSQEPVSTLQIMRVQNPYLYQQYAAKRRELSIRNQSNPERWLWHGSSACTVEKIINNGFNRSYCGKNGTAYGNGVYFAVNSSYSVGYCHPDSQGLKHIFLAQVLTGDSCQGKSGMSVLPQKESASKAFLTYDSATDSLTNPNMFVIFHDSQAYPAYHITFI